MGRYSRIIAVVLFLAILLAVAELSGLRQHMSLAYLRQIIDAHPVSGLVIFVLLFSLGNLIHIPGFLFLIAAILALGRTWGGLITYVAASTSCVVTFLTIRAIGGDALLRLDNRLMMRILAHLHQRPVRSVFLLRTLFQTLPAVNLALALSGIRLRRYVAGTLLGLPLPIATFCLFFDGLRALFHLG